MRLKHFIFWAIAMLLYPVALAAPVITFGSISSTSVSKFDKVEITYTLGSYASPHDPSVINTYAEFWSPSGKYFKVYGFYFSEFTKADFACTTPVTRVPFGTYSCESYTSTGTNNWKVRFTPDEQGSWTYKVTAIDVSGTTVYPSSGTNSFTCNPSTHKGFIVNANSKFLKRKSGTGEEFFFPVGLNVPWHRLTNYTGNEEYGTNEYKYFIDKLSDNGANNFIRIWLDFYEGLALIGHEYTNSQMYFNLYNQKDAAQLDWIINYAKSKDINIMLTLTPHISWGNVDSPSNWSTKNPYNSNKGGPLSTPFEFFSNTTAINKNKNLTRYIIARWGYATNLMCWELWNEVNGITPVNPTLTPPSSYLTDIANWHYLMYDYIKSIDPFQHLVTTSYAGGASDSDYSILAKMDFWQLHNYKLPSSTDDFQEGFYQESKKVMELNKPQMSGEWGSTSTNWKNYDPKGVEIHNSLWSTSFSTAMGAPAAWQWDQYINYRNLYSVSKPITSFMNALPIPSSSFSSQRILNANGLRTFYMLNTNADTIYGWTQDLNFHVQTLANGPYANYLQTLNAGSKPPSSSTNHQITIPVVADNRQYIVQWYSAETGTTYGSSTTVTSSGGNIVISIPVALRTSTYGDAVFKVFMDCNLKIWREGLLNSNVSYQTSTVGSSLNLSQSNGRVYFRTSSNGLNALIWDASSNSWQFSSLNNAATNVAGDIVANEVTNNVFYRATDNKIRSIKFNNTTNTWYWSSMNNASPANVAGSIFASAVNGQIFYKTTSNQLNSLYWDAGSSIWVWLDLSSVAINFSGEFTVSANNEVIYKTTSGGINKVYWDPVTSWTWSSLNNAVTGGASGSISVASNGQIFFRNNSGELNSIYHNGSVWTWSGLNGVANDVDGDVHANFSGGNGGVFYRSGNNIKYAYWNGIWYKQDLSSLTGSTVTAGSIVSNNLLDIFYKHNSNNSIHRLYYRSQCQHLPSTSFLRTGEINTDQYDGVDETSLAEHSSLSVFPNPAKGSITIESEGTLVQYQIINTQGQVVLERSGLSVNQEEINISELNEGIYIIKGYLSDGQNQIKKFVVVK